MNVHMMKRFAHGAIVPVAVLLFWQALSTFRLDQSADPAFAGGGGGEMV